MLPLAVQADGILLNLGQFSRPRGNATATHHHLADSASTKTPPQEPLGGLVKLFLLFSHSFPSSTFSWLSALKCLYARTISWTPHQDTHKRDEIRRKNLHTRHLPTDKHTSNLALHRILRRAWPSPVYTCFLGDYLQDPPTTTTFHGSNKLYFTGELEPTCWRSVSSNGVPMGGALRIDRSYQITSGWEEEEKRRGGKGRWRLCLLFSGLVSRYVTGNGTDLSILFPYRDFPVKIISLERNRKVRKRKTKLSPLCSSTFKNKY